MHDLTLVFDLDGTLVDTAPDLVAATNHALDDLGLAPVSAAALKPFISLGARRMIVEGLGLSGRAPGEAETDRLLALFLTHYEANIARFSRPYPGAAAAIGALKARGARIAVCTNKREKLSLLLLEAVALLPLVDAVAGRDTFPVSKPDPGHLVGAVRLAGGDPGQSIMVGDTNVDMSTARAAGVPAVGVAFGYPDCPLDKLKSDITINHFDELIGAVEMIRPRFRDTGLR